MTVIRVGGVDCPLCGVTARYGEVRGHFSDPVTTPLAPIGYAVEPARLTHWSLACGHDVSGQEWILVIKSDGSGRFEEKGSRLWN